MELTKIQKLERVVIDYDQRNFIVHYLAITLKV